MLRILFRDFPLTQVYANRLLNYWPQKILNCGYTWSHDTRTAIKKWFMVWRTPTNYGPRLQIHAQRNLGWNRAATQSCYASFTRFYLFMRRTKRYTRRRSRWAWLLFFTRCDVFCVSNIIGTDYSACERAESS